jgi:hypothetical protein
MNYKLLIITTCNHSYAALAQTLVEYEYQWQADDAFDLLIGVSFGHGGDGETVIRVVKLYKPL